MVVFSKEEDVLNVFDIYTRDEVCCLRVIFLHRYEHETLITSLRMWKFTVFLLILLKLL